MSDNQQTQAPDGIDYLIETHGLLFKSVAGDDDLQSLVQPSPLRYVPSITTDRTSQPEESR